MLPLVIDVGTNNKQLKDDDNYLGLKNDRLENEEYYEIIDEFMEAMSYRYKDVFYHFEDISLKYGLNII